MGRLGETLEFITNGLRAGSTREFYDRAAGLYDGAFPTQAAWTEALLEHGPPAAHTGLDIACGTGASTEALGSRCCRVIAVDFSKAMLDRARERLPEGKYRFVQGDFLRLPVKEAATLACCVGGARHVPPGEEVRFLEQARNALKTGGMLVIPAAEPGILQRAYAALYNTFMRARGLNERIAFWTPERTEALYRKAGFLPHIEPVTGSGRLYAAWGVKQ